MVIRVVVAVLPGPAQPAFRGDYFILSLCLCHRRRMKWSGRAHCTDSPPPFKWWTIKIQLNDPLLRPLYGQQHIHNVSVSLYLSSWVCSFYPRPAPLVRYLYRDGPSQKAIQRTKRDVCPWTGICYFPHPAYTTSIVMSSRPVILES